MESKCSWNSECTFDLPVYKNSRPHNRQCFGQDCRAKESEVPLKNFADPQSWFRATFLPFKTWSIAARDFGYYAYTLLRPHKSTINVPYKNAGNRWIETIWIIPLNVLHHPLDPFFLWIYFTYFTNSNLVFFVRFALFFAQKRISLRFRANWIHPLISLFLG